MRISDWSSDVCSSDLGRKRPRQFFDILLNQFLEAEHDARAALRIHSGPTGLRSLRRFNRTIQISLGAKTHLSLNHAIVRIENVADTASAADGVACDEMFDGRSEEHTSELQSLMRISYAVFCLKKKNNYTMYYHHRTENKQL